MDNDLVQRARWGDLAGQNWAGLVRLSFEVDEGPGTGESDATGTTEAKAAFRPMTGRDIRSRDEQEKDNRSFVESRGGRYVFTYEEPDTSAWKRKRVRLPNGEIGYRVIRPVFEGALEDLKRGTAPNGERLDGLIVYDIDRLTRDNRHLEDAIEVVENFKRPIIDITGTLDLLTDNGRTVARIVTATANKQSADTARRVTRKHRALQQAGIPTGGVRPFGWKEDKRTLNPEEAEWLRKIVHWLLEGKPISAIIRKLNDAGVTTSTGRKWSHPGLKAVVRNPRLCGYRSRQVIDIDPVTGTENKRVEIVLDAEGKPVIGQWESVVSVEEWEAVTEMLGPNPEPGLGHNTRKYLLRGTLRCDRDGCGAPLRVRKAEKSRNKPEGYFYYTCPSSGSVPSGCGGTKIGGPETDKAVSMMVIAKHQEETAKRQAEPEPMTWDKEEELTRVNEDIGDLKQARKARIITAETYFTQLAELEAEKRRLRNERNRILRSKHTAERAPVDLAKTWNDLLLSEQRAYVEDLLLAVLVAPAVGRGRPVRERLTPMWRPKGEQAEASSQDGSE
ncbi:recombinase family protein [Streptomyces alanosinicus]|uniref:Integrase n=1 Tax=Streptomyces alanosinicus TaxID=68171 RepID=A0A918YI09_9ACTN|nr:recombinase family protein [Streptomyces alanosinicus]GHE04005.1 integrase [Streptomyces alanosinicus]